jgi:hypothetical protein
MYSVEATAHVSRSIEFDKSQKARARVAPRMHGTTYVHDLPDDEMLISEKRSFAVCISASFIELPLAHPTCIFLVGQID